MSETRKSLGVAVTPKALWLYRGWWLVIGIAVLTVAASLVVLGLTLKFEAFLQLGLLQPAIAAIGAFATVLSLRLLGGPFRNERRKGGVSASSTAIAVRLWAMSFALLVGAMLLSGLVARLPDKFQAQAGTPLKVVEERSEVKSAAGASTITHSTKVAQ
jgi:membrane protease YdiL (CAAX protease family)